VREGFLKLDPAQLEAEKALMAYIHGQWGALIRAATQNSRLQISESFLAALIANESGGDADAKRLEKKVFAELMQVSQGRKPNWGSITLSDIQSLSSDELMDMATSWGLTQVMGYHTLALHRPARDLAAPQFNVAKALEILENLSRRWSIDARRQPEKLLDAWNTGRPNGKTYDPDYIPSGILRMGIYDKLLAGRHMKSEIGDFRVSDPEMGLD
jgi:hypothetical protein